MTNQEKKARAERNLVYTGMLDRLMTDNDYVNTGCLRAGLCYLFNREIKNYPELMQYKPRRYYNNNTRYWFNPYTEEGTDKRIVILLCAIMETL